MSINMGSDGRRTARPLHPGRLVALPTQRRTDVDAHLVLVDALITEVIADLADLWARLPDEDSESAEILGTSDLPQFIAAMMRGGGKRLRPVMSYLGWLAAGGRRKGVGHREVVKAGAALELLHLFVLVHDDVMDESTSRRGQPTVHVQAARLHVASHGTGSAQRFGESIAVLVGDLAHAEAGNLVADLPPPMRRIWRILVAELVAGQRRDLIGSATGRRDLSYARGVARMKSGRYTVERPLELGATAAAASSAAGVALAAYGRAMGEAFALRDDILGVWGDPARTGKPAGDDLVSGKPTVILALAELRLGTGSARAALGRVGSAGFTVDDLLLLQREMVESGVVASVEQMITDNVRTALDALTERSLDPVGVEHLSSMAHRIAWRHT